jgi:hypothetical protein
MNLQENIQRIQSLLTENREEMVKNMISKHGLYHTIRLLGGYDRILNVLGRDYFTNDDKIDFIRKVIKFVTKKYNTTGISTHELNMNPITFGTLDPMGLEFQQIEYFSDNFVTVDVYDTDSHKGSFGEKYENLDDDTLDEVFKIMIEVLVD